MQTYTYQQAAEILHCSVRTIQRFVQQGKLARAHAAGLPRIAGESLREACEPVAAKPERKRCRRARPKVKEYV
jgi:excisionase family DNA binding protein